MPLTKKVFPFVYISFLGLGKKIVKIIPNILSNSKNFILSDAFISKSNTITTSKNLTVT